jgi:hypothetical protein
MTENPMQYENSVIYQAPGINDDDSKLYKDYDKTGRAQNLMLHKAIFSGVNNLKTIQYRQDSPINLMQERFPDKYNSNKRGDLSYVKDEKGHSRERNSSQQQASF